MTELDFEIYTMIGMVIGAVIIGLFMIFGKEDD